MAVKKPVKKANKQTVAKSSIPAVKSPAPSPPSNELQIRFDPGKTEAQQYAEVGLQGVAPNAAIAGMYLGHTGFGGLGITESVQALRATAARVESGDFKDSEAMLVSQAATLNAIFANLAGQAFRNMGEYPAAMERYLRLAFKAQSQARCTLETLSEIRNPRQVTFAKQVNNSNGPQQVNNGTGTANLAEAPPTRTEETGSAPNKLLEVQDAEWVDAGAAGAAAAGNPEVAAVATVHRPDFARGKVRMRSERVERRGATRGA